MSGIYIHIPFCKQACHYCDFHFSTVLKNRTEMIHSICRELEVRSQMIKDEVQTIYLGGGTPSILNKEELSQIFEAVYKYYKVVEKPEITLEANPDDLTASKLKELRDSPVNRLSIGIQSFHQPHLEWMNRAHNSQEALSCIKDAKDHGFEQLSLDLIYGIPTDNHSHDVLHRDLEQFMELRPTHLSAYSLTIEPNTAFGRWEAANKLIAPEEDFAAEQFEIVMNALSTNGYDHYEISNFCLEENYSKHNTSYWEGKHYLGIGPGAHSYFGDRRSSNVSNNTKYIEGVNHNELDQSIEVLSTEDKINDYLLTRLRTKWGLDLGYLKTELGFSLPDKVQYFIEDELLTLKNKNLVLTHKGKFLADYIASQLFVG